MPGTLEGDNDSTKVDLMRKLAAQAVALPAPLTETIVREVLHELEDGSRHALQTTLDCYKQKRMSAEDLISFVKTLTSFSKTLKAAFESEAAVPSEGELASPDDLAFLFALAGAPLPPSDQTATTNAKVAVGNEKQGDIPHESAPSYREIENQQLKEEIERLRKEALEREKEHARVLEELQQTQAQNVRLSDALSKAQDKLWIVKGARRLDEEDEESTPPLRPEEDQDATTEMLVRTLKTRSSQPIFRPARGMATVKADPSLKLGMSVVLHVADGVLAVYGGPELDRRLLEMPLHHILVELVPGHDNMFHVTANLPDRAVDGIYVTVKDRGARDRWLSALSAMQVKVKDWRPAPGMAREWKMERPLANTGTLPLVRWLS
jgi:hypothetical protein